MPSHEQIMELYQNCSSWWDWDDEDVVEGNHKDGWHFKGSNNGSFFLPAIANNGDSPLGLYWSSTLNLEYLQLAFGLFICEYYADSDDEDGRYAGRAVRPVWVP